MQRPFLTASKVDRLRTLAAYARSQADELSGSPCADQRRHASEVLEGCEWLGALCNWYDETHAQRQEE